MFDQLQPKSYNILWLKIFQCWHHHCFIYNHSQISCWTESLHKNHHWDWMKYLLWSLDFNCCGLVIIVRVQRLWLIRFCQLFFPYNCSWISCGLKAKPFFDSRNPKSFLVWFYILLMSSVVVVKDDMKNTATLAKETATETLKMTVEETLTL